MTIKRMDNVGIVVDDPSESSSRLAEQLR